MALKVLAISGSLRAASINSAFLRAAQQLAPADIVIDIYGQLGDLPLFNPDIETLPPIVRALWRQAEAADAMLIASPEYAHGVTGAIKNGLDWLVGHENFAGKPVALVNTSPRATHAYAALRETLVTMDARIVERASVAIALHAARLDTQGMVDTPHVAGAIRQMLADLRDGCGDAARASAT